jgi:hypothetical protein
MTNKLLTLGLVLALASCTKPTGSIAVASNKNSQNDNGCPKLVQLGARACDKTNRIDGVEYKGMRVCEVGIAENMDDVQLRRTMAENDARLKHARAIQNKVTDQVKQYKERVSRGGKGATDADAEIASISRTQLNMTGTVPIEYCIGNDGTEYVLVELLPNVFQDAVRQLSASLAQETKQEIEAKADQAFSELGNGEQ